MKRIFLLTLGALALAGNLQAMSADDAAMAALYPAHETFFQYELHPIELNQQTFADLKMTELQDYRNFVAMIARLNYDGEELADGEEFLLENDDAAETLNGLIHEARRLTEDK